MKPYVGLIHKLYIELKNIEYIYTYKDKLHSAPLFSFCKL